MTSTSAGDADAEYVKKVTLKLQNGVTSLKRELGPGEVERIIDERKREKELFDDAGLIYPGTVTSSGQILGDEGNGEPGTGNGITEREGDETEYVFTIIPKDGGK